MGDDTLMRGALRSTLGEAVLLGESSSTPVGDDTLTRGALCSAQVTRSSRGALSSVSVSSPPTPFSPSALS